MLYQNFQASNSRDPTVHMNGLALKRKFRHPFLNAVVAGPRVKKVSNLRKQVRRGWSFQLATLLSPPPPHPQGKWLTSPGKIDWQHHNPATSGKGGVHAGNIGLSVPKKKSLLSIRGIHYMSPSSQPPTWKLGQYIHISHAVRSSVRVMLFEYHSSKSRPGT